MDRNQRRQQAVPSRAMRELSILATQGKWEAFSHFAGTYVAAMQVSYSAPLHIAKARKIVPVYCLTKSCRLEGRKRWEMSTLHVLHTLSTDLSKKTFMCYIRKSTTYL